ncbi:ribosomal subunit s4 [Trichoderma arundinaceum]|uniref:Ribosomal subunit s4 n=1 Tax=Trichoderma arundinaceum TaxID=490622 RepID=A0A395NXJ7_TRIAR|nr:ribosomal subunit s4 [Trichoderma arundinaceum]
MSSVNAPRGSNANRNQPRSTTPFNNAGPAIATSGIPRPILEPQPQPSESSSGGVSASRQKQSKRDEAIRRKMENDLSKKKTLTGRSRQIRRAPPGTVLALKPSQALQIKPATTVSEAAQLMAAKREDCVLVTDDEDRIAGIFTAKDLAFRVVGAGLKAANVTIAEIMTKNPLCARTDTSATDALDLMVRKGFRHLPVMDENQDISGVLDITKCFYDAMEKLERAYSSSRKLYDALEGVQSELGASQPQQIIQYVEALRSKMSGPTLETVLNGIPPTTVSVRTSVKEAAAMMKENHTTAVLVQDQGAITGIFTSKDVVLRVIAPGLDPANCSVVRVMTPHPDFAPMDMTIQAALRKMHDGHYLNLPVMNDGGEIVGMVDVLKLTYATLEQINTMSSDNGEGPAWNKFWLSIDHETESMVSGDGSHSHHHAHHGGSRIMSPEVNRLGDSVAPNDSASHIGLDSPPRSIAPDMTPGDVPFAFKFKAPSGRVHRLQVVASQGIEAFVHAVASKLGNELDSIGGMPDVLEGRIDGAGFALSYMDNEGDTVSITTDNDLLEAILLARQAHLEKVDLFVHDSEVPPSAPSLDALPTPASSSTGLRERRRVYEEEESESEEEESEEEEERPVRRSRRTRTVVHQEQLIAGVPNDLLLPGAIVTLAVVIVGVFTIARATSR